MDSVTNVLSKFKNSLDSIINDYKEKVSEIEKEEELKEMLGDIVNYSKSDCLLLPFYDETMLSKALEHIFPLSSTEKNKIKTAKYLIEASKDVDKEQFPQYNTAVKELNEINKKISDYYEKLLTDDKSKSEKETLLNKINLYTELYEKINDEEFTSIIDNTDIFKEAVETSKLSNEEISILLNIAIKSNLKYLDASGIVTNDNNDIISMKNENDKMQEEIKDLSSLLGKEDLWNLKTI